MHVSKHYVYEGGTLLFDLRDNKTNLFVKYNDRISFVKAKKYPHYGYITFLLSTHLLMHTRLSPCFSYCE